MSVFLTEEVADSVSENDIFNAVLASELNHNSRIGRPIIIGKIGKIVTPNNMESLVSVVLWKMLQTLEDNSSPTLVGTVNQVKSEITTIVQNNSELFSAENFSSEMLGWAKDLPKKISQCVEDLFPLFFEEDEKIYQLSPVLLGFIASHSPENLQNKQFLLSLVKLFDTIKINAHFWGHDALMKLRTSVPYAFLKYLSQDPNLSVPDIDDENIAIYLPKKKSGKYVDSDYSASDSQFLDAHNVVTAEEIAENPRKPLCAIGFYSFTSLIDMKPRPGAVYIHSASEPYSEEQEISEERAENWIQHFGMNKYQCHCSGHANAGDLFEAVKTINAKTLFPVHTEHPDAYRKVSKNMTIVKEGVNYQIS